MKPRQVVSEITACTGSSLTLVQHDGRHFLECEGRQVDASHFSSPATQLVTTLSRPFRPARQPRLIFLGLGLGHALRAAREVLPQEKASFVVLPEAAAISDWLSQHLSPDPLDDERILLESLSPFDLLPNELEGSQGIVGDLDHLDALAPKSWSITSPTILGNYRERLKHGGLLGLLSTRPVAGLEKELRKAGFEVATDLAPLSQNSKKNRILYLARKGNYLRSH